MLNKGLVFGNLAGNVAGGFMAFALEQKLPATSAPQQIPQ